MFFLVETCFLFCMLFNSFLIRYSRCSHCRCAKQTSNRGCTGMNDIAIADVSDRMYVSLMNKGTPGMMKNALPGCPLV